jgi:hypothetical protein
MLVKYYIIAFRINIFRVDEETIHVEKAGAHIWEAIK